MLMKIYLFAWVITALWVVVLCYGFFIEPNTIQVSHIWIEGSALNTVLKGKTALHISDLHISADGYREKKLQQLIAQIKPDLIFLTGDYVPWEGCYEPALQVLPRLKAPLGVWAVMGDYDYSRPRMSCLFCHEPSSGKPAKAHTVRFLRNNRDRVELPAGAFSVIGIDLTVDRTLLSEKNMSTLIGHEPAILLHHNPGIFDYVPISHDVLILAGDTHGGQIPLPSYIWKLFGYANCYKYMQGFFKKGLKKMFVSRGIGTSHFKFRFLRPPELVVIHF